MERSFLIEIKFNPKTSGIYEKNDVLVVFIFTVRVFVRLFWRHQCRQWSGFLGIDSETNVHSYEHYIILFRSKVREKKSDLNIICLTFYQRYIQYELCDDKTGLCHMWQKKAADQPAQPDSLISLFVVRCLLVKLQNFKTLASLSRSEDRFYLDVPYLWFLIINKIVKHPLVKTA